MLRGGFLIRPFVPALVLGLPEACCRRADADAQRMGTDDTVPIATGSVGHPERLATSIMTVASIVFAILLMTLTLASTQFSPRILVSFVRDRGTQWTLGVFLGTFSYCMAALPRTRFVAMSRVRTRLSGAGIVHRRGNRSQRDIDDLDDAKLQRPVRTAELLGAFDIGPTRTLQQDYCNAVLA
jgi:hypothetical protein